MTTHPPSIASGIVIPADETSQWLAAVIFVEADARQEKNDEREAIGWCFVNSVAHANALCTGLKCGEMTDHQRERQCAQDRRDLGATIPESIKIGSAGYSNSRWRIVMDDADKMRTADAIAATLSNKPGDLEAFKKALTSASAVVAGTSPKKYLRFNQGGTAPSPRFQVEGGKIGAHFFFVFNANRECG